MARRAEARAPVVAEADLRLAGAAPFFPVVPSKFQAVELRIEAGRAAITQVRKFGTVSNTVAAATKLEGKIIRAVKS